jgi:hypothetical protein
VVDPQLKNNADLVECLTAFESSWEKGKEELTTPTKITQLQKCGQIIEEMSAKHRCFLEAIDCCDASIFMIIPGILVLRALDESD